jgi:hypothetical protein
MNFRWPILAFDGVDLCGCAAAYLSNDTLDWEKTMQDLSCETSMAVARSPRGMDFGEIPL